MAVSTSPKRIGTSVGTEITALHITVLMTHYRSKVIQAHGLIELCVQWTYLGL